MKIKSLNKDTKVAIWLTPVIAKKFKLECVKRELSAWKLIEKYLNDKTKVRVV